MKIQFILLIAISVSAGKSSNTRQGSSVPITVAAPSGPASNGYSQPIPTSYAVPQHSVGGRQEVYSYSQPMMMSASSNQPEYYHQPQIDPAYGGYAAASPAYARAAAAPIAGAGYYEPVPQGSGHYPHHPIKRGHGWAPHNELQTIWYIALPLIILPLLLLWPYFIYAASHHHHPVVYAGGWKRSSDGKTTVVSSAEEAKAKKTDELTEKILPKLEKNGKD